MSPDLFAARDLLRSCFLDGSVAGPGCTVGNMRGFSRAGSLHSGALDRCLYELQFWSGFLIRVLRTSDNATNMLFLCNGTPQLALLMAPPCRVGPVAAPGSIGSAD